MDALKNAKFAKSKLGKFIVNFAEFSSSMSQNYDALFDALDSLTANLEDQLTQANQANVDAEVIHNNLIINYENNRDSANSDVVSTKQTLSNLADDQVTYTNKISSAQASISNNNQAIADLNTANQDRITQYNLDVADVTSGIDSIDEALKLLRSLQTSTDTGAFIQTNDKALGEVKSKLEKSFISLSGKKKSHFRYRSLLTATIELMTKQNFVNQEALTQVINLLVDLRASLSEFSAKLDSDELNAQASYSSQLEALNTAVTLAEEDLANAKTNLENTNANIESQNEFLTQRTEDYDSAVLAISTENDLWNRRVQTYNDLVDEINAELRIVQEAIGALNAGGINRSENADTNSNDETD